MSPEDFHFPHSIITPVPCLSKADCRTTGVRTRESTHPPQWQSTHTPQPPSLGVGHSYCNQHEGARHTDRAAVPRPYAALMAELALTVDAKKPFLPVSGSSELPAASPPPWPRQPLPLRPAAPSLYSASSAAAALPQAPGHKAAPPGRQPTCLPAHCMFLISVFSLAINKYLHSFLSRAHIHTQSLF